MNYDGYTINPDLSAFNPDDESQIFYGLTDSFLGDDAGTTLVGMNGGGSEQTDSLFASVDGGDANPLDLWS